ncbi:MAG: class I SAM-dependent methyltransferase [Desulfobacterales bacterium]|nr:MAG: class I SAM-dependent methyltransferase [Desulfobacterales bacterium]
MTPSTAPYPRYSNTEPCPERYNSTILKLFVETLERWRDVQILDVGPVCQENIMFFAGRMRRHYACDMFLRLQREQGKKPGAGDVFRHLDYPPRSFDGIQLWDLTDHLDDNQVKRLVKRCFEMLRSTGLLMLIALETKASPDNINTFVIGQDYRLDIRVQQHLKLPWFCRHNRALVSLLADLNIVKSFRYRNGLREFLFKKPGLIRD